MAPEAEAVSAIAAWGRGAMGGSPGFLLAAPDSSPPFPPLFGTVGMEAKGNPAGSCLPELSYSVLRVATRVCPE